MKKIYFLLATFLLAATQLIAQQKTPAVVGTLKITILSTMLAQEGMGDWGFSALVETDTGKILFDSGGRRHVVLDNAKELDIDLSKVPTLVLSHGHIDHTAGWVTLRQELKPLNPSAVARTYVAPGFFDTLLMGGRIASRRTDSIAYAATGGKVNVIHSWTEITPGVFLIGNDVPRVYPEKNYPAFLKRKDASGKIVPDTVPEDMSMVIKTKLGLVLITGCGHSGTVNLLSAIEKKFPKQRIYAAIGGFHLLAASEEQIKWTAEALKKVGVRYFMGAHCTGIEPVYQIRDWAGLKKGESIVGSVGAVFDLDKGFIAGQLTMGNDKNAYFKK